MSNTTIPPSLLPAKLPLSAAQPPVPAIGTAGAQEGPSPGSTATTVAMPQDRLEGPTVPASGRAQPQLSLDLPANDRAEGPGQAQPKEDGWKFRLYFGMNRTKYYNSDVQIRSPNLNVDIKGLEWKERTSAAYYNPANWESFQNAFQWIDEPTNTFVLSATKNKHEFMLSAFHPKYLTREGQVKEVKGTVDGVAIDGTKPLLGDFEGGANQPGELYLTSIRNTHMQMDFQLGYGREFELFKTDKNSALVYRPAVYAGVMMGKTVSIYEQEPGQHVEREDKVRIHGATAAIGNKLEYRFRDRVSAMVEYKVSGAMLNQKVFDGTVKYNMIYTPLHFGLGVKLYDENKHR